MAPVAPITCSPIAANGRVSSTRNLRPVMSILVYDLRPRRNRGVHRAQHARYLMRLAAGVLGPGRATAIRSTVCWVLRGRRRDAGRRFTNHPVSGRGHSPP